VIFILSLTENLSNCPRDVEVETPFADVKLEYATAISYLDTIGRPKIVMKAKRLTDKHAGVVYVSLSGISYCTSNPFTGELQGLAHRSFTKTGCCDDWHIRTVRSQLADWLGLAVLAEEERQELRDRVY
jgi:hypothetical protein